MSPEKIREVMVRIRAKAFAKQMRNESHGWASFIPEADQEWLTDAEIPQYYAILQERGLKQQADKRWTAAW